MKTELWWASIGGNPCEPVRVVRGENGDTWFSIGCADPHPLSDAVALVEEIEPAPPTPKEQKRLERAWATQAKAERSGGYRRFD